MTSATVTSKGQITIPFVQTASGNEIHPQAASIKDLKGAVPRPTQPVSIEEMNGLDTNLVTSVWSPSSSSIGFCERRSLQLTMALTSRMQSLLNLAAP